jgi:hypothetical protein
MHKITLVLHCNLNAILACFKYILNKKLLSKKNLKLLTVVVYF